MSPSLYGFVEARGPVRPEEVAAEVLRLPGANGDARALVEKLVGDDPRFLLEDGLLRTAAPETLALDDATYVVFDVETTGASAAKAAMTEIGAIKLHRGEVIEEFSTLLNPKQRIDPFVVRLTGITDKMVADAPPIEEVMPRFEEFVEGTVLVAHNASFDCSFVAAARGEALPNPVLDTLKLARALVPGLRRYKLSALVSHLGVDAGPNHRALADAAATSGVLVKLLKMMRSAGVKTVGEAGALRARGKFWPQKQHLAEGIPRVPGVYYFLDKHGAPLYVGKAKNLSARVRTYFNGGDGRRKIKKLVEDVAEVTYEQTESELHALILEAREIKRLLPRYNSAGRSEEASWYLRFDLSEPYPVPERVPEAEQNEGSIHLGPYRSARTLDTCVEALGRIFPLKRCSNENGTCFYGQMGRCAPCMGIDPEKYRRRVVDEVVALLRGEGGEEHLSALVKERERLSGALEFEAAARLRDLISGIERVRLARAMINAEGVQAVVASSTEPGMIEVFVLSGGRLAAHQSFEAADTEGLTRFAGEALSESAKEGVGVSRGGDEARVVASYVRRRSAVVEAVRLGGVGDLLSAVERVGGAGEGSSAQA